MGIQELIDELRLTGAERSAVEAKSASGGCPKSIQETLSAFANTGGGTIILGISDGDFHPVAIDAPAVRDALANMASDLLTPPVRGDIDIEHIDGGHPVVVMTVAELDPTEKPCFVTARGRYGGSYTRVGDGDRRLTNYEVDRLVENHLQPEFDRGAVLAATPDDLDSDLLTAYLARIGRQSQRILAGLTGNNALRRLGVLTEADGVDRPTLAGLLTFGTYPQQFFPQLSITVVALPGTAMGDPGPAGERFLDNTTCEGPIPEMLGEAMRAIIRNMRRAAVIVDGGRDDRYDYPVEVVRELLVNAVMHRDYSPEARGAQVQVELYPDRLVVRSPGGFYGMVSPDRFGEPDVSSSRNALLARMLTDTPLPGSTNVIAENRGSGIPTVLRILHRTGMAPPEFDVDLRRVQVTITHDRLLTPEMSRWIDSLGVPHLTQGQRQALALMRSGHTVRNQTLQGWGLPRDTATQELSGLVRMGLSEKIGDRRGATYALATELAAGLAVPRSQLRERQDLILAFVAEHGSVTAKQLAEQIQVSRPTIINEVNELIKLGYLVASAPPQSRNRRYRLAPGRGAK